MDDLKRTDTTLMAGYYCGGVDGRRNMVGGNRLDWRERCCFSGVFSSKALQHDTTNLALQTAFFFFLWEWGGEGFFFLLVFQQVLGREMEERDVSHRETDVGETLSQKH
jgi:hypothetical protein